MPVTYLEIENFKSYAGKQTIGPFRDFTSVIGPNGSGKSNLMDAISFVLGVQSRDLRSSQMKDLIFRPPGTSVRNLKLRASVTLYFQDEETDQEMAFARAISPSGVGEYIVDGKTVPYVKYEEKLADIGVLVKARNFLVFQGDVESIARKSPKDFVALLEQISTSIDLAGDYDDALKAKEEADNAVRFEFNRQKGFKSERRMLKEQKEEAERFKDLLDQKAQVQTELYLWQLYHIDSDLKEQENTNVELQTEVEEKQTEEVEFSNALKAAKTKASAARRHTQKTDKKRVEAAAEVDKLEPQVIQATEEIKSLKKKIATAEKQLTKKKKDAENHTSNLEAIDTEIEEHKEQLKQLEKDYEEIKRDAVGSEVNLTEEQEEELVRVRQAAAAATVKPRRTLGGVTRQLNAARAKAQNLKQELEDAKKTLTDTEAQVATFTERKDKLTTSLENTKEEMKQKEKELMEAQQSLEQSQARREEIDRELEKINRTLRDAKDSRRKTKHEEDIAQAVASLKRNFPGVQGRLVDLCKPTQARFNLAITVAAGKDMEAIVVDTKETGHECIRHLREQRIGTATFLPLDSLQVPSVDSQERARALVAQDNRYRLAADCIAADEALKPAVLYAVGNTVVCDNLDCARELCFGRQGGGGNQQARVKAVTLGGAVISKAGTMTGGVTREDTNQAGRWGAAELDKLRETKETLENERNDLDAGTGGRGGRGNRRGTGGHGSRIEELRNLVGSQKNKEHYTKSDLGYTEKQLREKQNLLKSLDRQVKKLESDLSTAETEITGLDTEVQSAREAVKNAEEEILGPFREKTGLKDFEGYEEAVGERRKEFNEEKTKLLENITQLEQKHNYETNRDLKKPLQALEKRLKEHKKKLKNLKETEAKVATLVEERKEELATAEEAVKEASEQEEACDEEVQAAQQAYNEAQGELNKAKKAVSASEAASERLRSLLHETLQKARVEEVELPMIDDGTQKRSKSSADSNDDDEGLSMSQRSSTQDSSGPHFSQADSRKVQKDKRTASKVDYSQLDDQLKQRPSDREEKRMKRDFEDQINKISADIEATNPNMKAAEAFETVSSKLKESSTDYVHARETQSKASSDFQRIKSRRAKLFNDAFNHIDQSLKTIYQDMTRSSKHPLGGEAYLSLDDTEEPYLGGMKFNAMPPMKRFRDMEQLSGGEKTVAALSLLFAIHSYHPAPFFVMDEVDAALDNINLRKVCNYISQRSKTDFQCIVISLKDMFYERSESLVGVCRDVGTSSSRTLTLDLTAYDKNEGKKKKKKRGKKSKSETPKSPKRKSRRSAAAEDHDEEEDEAAQGETSKSPKRKSRRSAAAEDEDEDEEEAQGETPKSSKRKTRKSATATGGDDDEEEDEVAPGVTPKSPKRKTRKSAAAKKEDDDDEEEDEAEPPKSAKRKNRKRAKKDDNSSDEDEAAPPKSAKRKAAAKKDDNSSDEEDDPPLGTQPVQKEDDDEATEEESPPRKRKSRAPKKKDDDDDEDTEEESPPRKRKTRKSAAADSDDEEA